ISSPDVTLSVRTSSGTIALAWTPVPSASGYVLYRGPSPTDLEPFDVVADSFYIDTSPAPGITWYAIASTDGVNLSQSHSTNTGRDGQECVSSSGSHVTVNQQSCVGS